MDKPLDAKTYLQKLQTVAYVSLGFPLVFFIYVYLESSAEQLQPKIPSAYFLVVMIPVLLISAASIFWSFKKYNSMLAESIENPSLIQKLAVYRTANNYRFIVYGLIAVLISLSFYLTNYEPFAAIYGILLVLFSIHNPNTHKIVRELKLEHQEKEIILNGLEIK